MPYFLTHYPDTQELTLLFARRLRGLLRLLRKSHLICRKRIIKNYSVLLHAALLYLVHQYSFRRFALHMALFYHVSMSVPPGKSNWPSSLPCLAGRPKNLKPYLSGLHTPEIGAPFFLVPTPKKFCPVGEQPDRNPDGHRALPIRAVLKGTDCFPPFPFPLFCLWPLFDAYRLGSQLWGSTPADTRRISFQLGRWERT